MSEQNPYASWTQSGPAAFAPPPATAYAPAIPPQAAYPVQAPQAYQPWGTASVLPSHFAPSGSRRPSVSGPAALIAAVAVLALLVAGVFASGLLSSDREEAPVAAPRAAAPKRSAALEPAVPAKPSAPPAAKPKKPAAKPAPVPMGGKWVDVTADNSGTVGAPYRIVAPRDYSFERGDQPTEDEDFHIDGYMTDGAQTQELVLLSAPSPGVPDGPLPPSAIATMRKGIGKIMPGARALRGTSVASMAGTRATGFDYTATDDDGTKMRARIVMFGHSDTVHMVIWVAPFAEFPATVRTFQHIVATMRFTGPAVSAPDASST